MEPYHFPCLVATRFYSSPSELSKDERLLLEAQKLNLCGKLAESVEICRRLIDESVNPMVKFGAYYTNASNFLLLGCHTQLNACTASMEAICKKAPAHREDLRLLIEHVTFNITLLPTAYETIDAAKLSPDALPAYECFVLFKSLFHADTLTDFSISICSARCKTFENMGVAPLAIAVHSILASQCNRIGNKAAQEQHIASACRIAHETGVLRMLSKYSNFAPELFRKYMGAYGESFADKIEGMRENNIRRASLSRYHVTGDERNNEESWFLSSWVLLISYNLSNRQLALIQDVSKKEVRRVIAQHCSYHQLQTKKELVALYRDFFRRVQKEQP